MSFNYIILGFVIIIFLFLAYKYIRFIMRKAVWIDDSMDIDSASNQKH